MERYNMTREILKINLDVENVYRFGVKTTRKKVELMAKFAWEYMCPEIYNIQRKVQGNKIDYEN